VNLGEAMDRIRALLKKGSGNGGEEVARGLVKEVKRTCGAVHEEDLRRCMQMGRLGAEWLWAKRRGGTKGQMNGHASGSGESDGDGRRGLKVLTLCNTGSLATSVSPARV
jgi:methylthioribose-1-phosphate isomerase